MSGTKPSLSSIDTKIDFLAGEIRELKVSFAKEIEDIKNEEKENTKFRLQATSIIGFIAFVSTAIGGAIMWIAQKLWK